MKPTKQQWLILKHEIDVVEALKSASFFDDINPGFELREINKLSICARYIEKLEALDVVEDPFGGTEEIRSVRYVYFDFEISELSKGVSLVKLIRPPVSLKGFVKLIIKAFNNEAYLDKVKFVLADIYDALSISSEVDRIIVNKIVASRVPIGLKSTARLEVVSDENALSEFRSVYPDPRVKLDRLSMSLRLAHTTEVLEVSSAGFICCTPGVEQILKSNIAIN
ncbi:hypothetical protein HRF68_20235 [Pseudomonas stutzeri]|nr:hypothetical protein [Stutzerimonas stutzeri]